MGDITKSATCVAATERDSAERQEVSWRRTVCLFFGAIWLQAIVLIFIVVQLSRLNTPITSWIDKAINLLLQQ